MYIGRAAFQEALGTPGVPVQGGGYVANSLVLPETESRKIPGIGGDVFLEYGINGLLCASLGNFLGLPDLFDTKSGATAIGRFGLMDGQGIFSFSGVFPPEPSAWEKYWLDGSIQSRSGAAAQHCNCLQSPSPIQSIVCRSVRASTSSWRTATGIRSATAKR